MTSSSFSVPSDYGNQFLNQSHNEEIFEQHPVLQQTTPIPTTTTTPPIITEAPAIILEITPFIALQLRVATLKQYIHTADLVEKYFVLPAPESSKKHESEKSPEEIIIIKSEQEEKKQEPTLYHALMEALIEDENTMDKEVAKTVKDHKRKHDGDDDDDDEGLPAGSN
ncbi:hypothetical protein Tco_0942203 [Tanacetum coccineum]